MTKFSTMLDEASKMFDSESSYISKEFIQRHMVKILILVILLLSYIQLRYEYENHLLTIGRLKQERNEKRYTSIEKWSILTAQSRPENIRRQVSDSNVDLVESGERPVIIE